MMEEPEHLQIDEDFVFYSLVYSAITVIFAFGVIQKFITSELQVGYRSIVTLGVLFIGEPVCHFLLKGSTGTVAYGLVCLFLYSILPASHLSGRGKSVLITGCDSGFGHALAQHLDQVGMIVYAGCLHHEGPGAIQLHNNCSERLQILKLDVTSDEDVSAAYDLISTQQHEQGLWGVAYCASQFSLSDLELTPSPVYQRTLDVNYLGAVRVTQRMLPLVRQSRGRIVNLGSFTGQVPVRYCGAYSASMHALHAYSHVLRQEMSRFGVRVSLVEPGGFRTSPTQNSSLTAQKVELWSHVSETVRQVYGHQYLDDVYSSYSNLSQTLTTDLSPVTRALKSALLSKRPRDVYPCSKGVLMLTGLYPLVAGRVREKLEGWMSPVGQGAVPQSLMRRT